MSDICDDFLFRTRALDQIRSDLYLSGTYVRDYLSNPDRRKPKAILQEGLLHTRSDMGAALHIYERLLNAQEAGPFRNLTEELHNYWHVLEPVFLWNATARQDHGYAFLQNEVFPRRTAMLQIADQIADLNESQLNAGKKRGMRPFRGFANACCVTIGLTLGIGLLLAVFRTRKILRLEAEAETRYREIAAARAQLRELSARLVDVQETERRSIARELHDEVGQALAGVRVELANLSRDIRSHDTSYVEAKIDAIKTVVDDAVGVVRNMALLLRPPMLDDLGLVPALQWQAREVWKRTGVPVKVAAESVSEDLPDDHKTCIYRIVQEALHNCVQHASPSMVRVTVHQGADRILLSIQDNGKGFSAEQECGMGLLGIRERVSHLGGTFSIESQPGQGTILCVDLPVKGHAERHLQTTL